MDIMRVYQIVNDGIKVYGSSCLFTTTPEEAYVEIRFNLIDYDK